MSVDLVCPACGHANKTVGVFCSKCGGRMTQPGLQPAQGGPSPWRALGLVARLVAGLAVLLVAVLMLWPAPAQAPGGPDEAAWAEAAGEGLRALERAARSGRPLAHVFSEEEINAYLAERVRAAAGSGAGGGIALRPSVARVTLTDGRFRFLAVVRYGPVPVAYTVAGRFEEGPEGRRPAVDSAAAGRLVFPGGTGGWIAGKLRSLLSGLDVERNVLRNASRVDLAAGRARVVVGMGRVESTGARTP